MSDIILIFALLVLPSQHFVIMLNTITVDEARAGKPGKVQTRQFANTQEGFKQFMDYMAKLPEDEQRGSTCYVNAGAERGVIQDSFGRLARPQQTHAVAAVEKFAADEKLGALSADVATRFCRTVELKRSGFAPAGG